MNNSPSRKGFTLIEILCVLILAGLLGAFFLGGYVNSVKMHIAADSNYQQAQKAQLALLRIILEMQIVTTPSVSGNIITYSFNGESRKIKLIGTNIILYTDSDSTNHTLLDNVTDFTANYASENLSISFKTTFSGSTSKTFSTSVYVPAS
jgi:prepilin-type N-terminal cleavage/methylation domain-containing protein